MYYLLFIIYQILPLIVSPIPINTFISMWLSLTFFLMGRVAERERERESAFPQSLEHTQDTQVCSFPILPPKKEQSALSLPLLLPTSLNWPPYYHSSF